MVDKKDSKSNGTAPATADVRAAVELWGARDLHSSDVLEARCAIAPQHVDDLRRSGLSDATVRRCRFRTIEGDDAGSLLGWKKGGGMLGPGLLIPFLDRHGTPTGFARLKPDK